MPIDSLVSDSPKPVSDQELVEASRAGSSEAFATLLRRYQRALFNAAYRILGNADEAQDAVQNALIRIHRNLDRYDPSRAFSSWAFRISVNEALRLAHRRPAERPEGLAGDSAILEVVASENPLRELTAGEAREQILQAVGSLSVDLRAVLVLRHFRELSYSEISEIVDVPEKTVKSRLFEARRRLRAELIRRGTLR